MVTGSKPWPEPARTRGWAWALVALLAAPALAAETGTLALTLQRGDTLIGVSERYLQDPRRWPELQRLNRIGNARRLQPGASLQIPLAWLRWSELPVEVVHVTGQVTGNRGLLALGMRLRPGDSFDTGQGTLTLRFDDGALAVFAPQTRAALGESRETPIGGVRDTRIDLNQGAVETTVTPLPTPSSRFDVKTPRVVTAVRGTRFRVAQEERASRHEVLEGRVSTQGAGQAAVDIAAGSGLRADNGQLGAVVRLLPAPDLAAIPRTIERTSALLRVPPLTGASAWRWQVALDARFAQLLQDARTREPSWLLTGLPDGDYYLRVRGADAQSLEGSDALLAFALRARPEAPLKLSPPDGSSVSAGTPLAWAELPGAPTYHLQIARDAAFTDTVFDQAGLSGNRKIVDPPLAPGLYHWRIATQRPDGSRGPFGDPASFTLLEPSSVAPPQLGAAGLQLAWSGPAGFRHQVQVSHSPDFARPAFDQVVAGTSLTLPDPKPGSYHVRTRVILPDASAGPWSESQHFEVPPPPPPPPPPPSHPWYLLLILLLPLL